jgi:hypothetical protein
MRRLAHDVNPAAERVRVLLQMALHSLPPEFADLQRGKFVRRQYIGSGNDRGRLHGNGAGQVARLLYSASSRLAAVQDSLRQRAYNPAARAPTRMAPPITPIAWRGGLIRSDLRRDAA